MVEIETHRLERVDDLCLDGVRVLDFGERLSEQRQQKVHQSVRQRLRDQRTRVDAEQRAETVRRLVQQIRPLFHRRLNARQTLQLTQSLRTVLNTTRIS